MQNVAEVNLLVRPTCLGKFEMDDRPALVRELESLGFNGAEAYEIAALMIELDENIDRLGQDLQELDQQVQEASAGMVALVRSQARQDNQLASIAARIDRIERRLGLVDPFRNGKADV